jgi:hypothetical protein
VGLDLGRLKKQASVAATLAGLAAFAVGVLAFALALRPCKLAFEPGEIVSYRLTTTTSELGADGKPGPARVEVRTLQLVCTGPDNEVAMISPAADGSARRDQVTLLDFSPEGSALRLDPAGRPAESGAAVGFFDFNLLPLPEGSEQPRDVTITYAVLPTARNPVQGRVRRAKSGTKPTFQLKLQSSVEWLSLDNRYHQVRDLVSTYRFNAAKNLVEDAEIKLIAGIERDDGAHRYAVQMQLTLDGPVQRTNEDPRRLREAVLASAEAQDLLRADDRERSAAAAERLRAAAVALPQLRALADRIADAIQHPTPEPAKQWLIVVARGAAREHAAAERLARLLIAGGYAASLRIPEPQQLAVVVGPYPSADPVVMGALTKAFPGYQPQWVEVP